MTALPLACMTRYEDAAKMLVLPTLATGSLNVRSTAFTCLVGNHSGYSALMWAEEWGLTSVVKMLHAGSAAVVSVPALVLLRGGAKTVQLDLQEKTVVFLSDTVGLAFNVQYQPEYLCAVNLVTLRSAQWCPFQPRPILSSRLLRRIMIARTALRLQPLCA